MTMQNNAKYYFFWWVLWKCLGIPLSIYIYMYIHSLFLSFFPFFYTLKPLLCNFQETVLGLQNEGDNWKWHLFSEWRKWSVRVWQYYSKQQNRNPNVPGTSISFFLFFGGGVAAETNVAGPNNFFECSKFCMHNLKSPLWFLIYLDFLLKIFLASPCWNQSHLLWWGRECFSKKTNHSAWGCETTRIEWDAGKWVGWDVEKADLSC